MLAVDVKLLLFIFVPILIILVITILILFIVLIIANKKNEIEKKKFDYFSKIIHDLKTPIYAIDGFTLLSIKSLDQLDKAEEYLNKISNVSHHMLALVNDVIDLSKINNNKLEIHINLGDLNDVIDRCLDNVEPQILKRKIQFEKNVQILHNKVLVDDLRLIQILTNLLSNAIKYTEPKGKIVLSVLEENNTKDASKYIFEVKDTGFGMSEEFQKHIFEPFAQEHTLAHTDAESSGLGLFIVKKLVEMMHGTIVVDSKLNEGSCFKVVIDLDILETLE